MPSTESLAVVVCTRGRAQHLQRTLEAVLASPAEVFELLVVDQSVDDASERVVRRAAAGTSRVRYVRDDGVGSARAHNLAASLSAADLLLFLDDECVPQPGWLQSMAWALRQDPTAGIAFGTVLPCAVDESVGFCFSYVPRRRRRLRGPLAKLVDAGIGGNMALRRSALLWVGGFDEMLGPGAHFPGCMDCDMTYRLLRRGYSVLHVPEARVVHYGLRDWTSGGPVVRDRYLGIGAAYMKLVRLRDPVGALLLAQQLALALVEVARRLARRRRPWGIGRLLSLLEGMRRSFDLDVDPRTARYVAAAKGRRAG